MSLHPSKRLHLMTGLMLLLSSSQANAANVVTNGNSAGPGSFPYELAQANINSNPVTFSAGAAGQTCQLLGDVPLPAGLTNMVTIDNSGVGFTIVGNTHGVLPIYAISNSGNGTAGTTFNGNGSITFLRSGLFNRSSGTMINTFAAGNYTFDIDSGIVNQGTGTMINTFTGGTFSLPFLSGIGNGGAGKMINNVMGGTFNFAGGSGFGNAGTGTQINNISGGTITFTNNVLPPLNNFGGGLQINNISGGSITLFGSKCFVNKTASVQTNNISGGTLSYSKPVTWGFVNEDTSTMTNNISGGTISFTNGATGFVNTGTGTMTNSITGGTIYMNEAKAALGTELKFSGTGIFSSGVNGVTFGGSYFGQGYSGNLTFSSSTATHQAAIGVGSLPVRMSTPITATGTSTATLNGAILDVVSAASPSTLVGSSYVILDTATGAGFNPSIISGTYGKLTSSSLIKYTVVYDYSGPMRVTVIPNVDQSFSGYVGGGGSNAYKIAQYLDTLSNLTGDPAFIVLNDFILAGNTSGYQNALNTIQPSQLEALPSISFNNMTAVTEIGHTQIQAWTTKQMFSHSTLNIAPGRMALFEQLVTKHMSEGDLSTLFNNRGRTPQKKGLLGEMALANSPSQVNPHPLAGRIQVGKANIWIQPYGQFARIKGNSNGNPNLRSRLGGLTMGADYEISKNAILGLLGGSSTTPFTWNGNRGWGHMNSGFGGLYGAWKENCGFYAEGQAFFGGDKFKTARKINYSTINRTARETHNAFQFTGNVEFGYAIPTGDATFQPFIIADYMVLNEGKYTETGAGSLNMHIKSRTSQFFQGELGAMVYKTFVVDDILFRPTAELGWVQRRPIGDNKNNVKGGFINQPSTLVVTGANKVYNQIAPGLGLIAQFPNGLYVSGNVYAQCGSGLDIGEALLRVGYQF